MDEETATDERSESEDEGEDKGTEDEEEGEDIAFDIMEVGLRGYREIGVG